MNRTRLKRMVICAILADVAVAGSMFSFPILGSRCAPIQHMVNIICAVFLGPGYGIACAFLASLIRNLLGLGSLMAFPGSMIGALCCGLLYWKTKKLLPTLIAEIAGTGVLGGLCAYPIAVLFMGADAGSIAFYAYIIPFLISTVAGSIIAGLVISGLNRSGALEHMKYLLDK
ncbi:MAG: energy coupling factor transporter S component ThiW [Clostridia bacterium]|nr:energy coupling factor transporter S component ThiW [Clostridia bacterium]